jgi:3-oxoacyl-[acyl-carrier protein] reductase
MSTGIEGKVALVTGATRGIGKAIAQRLAREGAIVVGTATSESGASSISAYLEEMGAKGQGVVLNVTQPDAIEALVDAIAKQFGTPQILVNNAGITRDNLMLRMKEQEWDDVIDTNLTSIFRLAKACLKGMTRARWGRIVSIGSIVGSMGNAGQANYAAAKAGLEGFSRALAKEVGSRNITVNTVAPGFIDTDMTKDLPAANKEAMLSQIPAGRLGMPEEIAAAVAFLVSQEAAYVTGATLPVNGGMYM